MKRCVSEWKEKGQWDEAAWRRPRPFFNVPIVVSPDHGGRKLPVATLEKVLAAEPGPRREAHRRQDAIGVHVTDTLVNVPRPLTHLPEVARLHAPLLAHPPGHRVQPEAVDFDALDEPGVGAVGPGHHGDQVVVNAHQDHVVGLHAMLPLSLGTLAPLIEPTSQREIRPTVARD